MRLGDLDELKKYKFTTQIANGVEIEDIEVVPVAAIDNAMTVEITEEQAIDKLHETGWLQEHDKQMTERPQGEWIENVERRGCFAGDKTVYSYTCPFCRVKEFKKYPFCHCGAELKGGAK